jgi:hypothetical protein
LVASSRCSAAISSLRVSSLPEAACTSWYDGMGSPPASAAAALARVTEGRNAGAADARPPRTARAGSAAGGAKPTAAVASAHAATRRSIVCGVGLL